MKEKSIGSQRVLFIGRELSIPEIADQASVCCAKIIGAVEYLGLEVVGPWVFVSHKIPNNSNDRFRIEFCLPVQGNLEKQIEGVRYQLLPALHCIYEDYRGPISDLFSHGYAKLVEGARAAGCRLTDESREVYHNWQGPDSLDNHIELQFGIV